MGEPVYVVRKDAATNTVTVGPREALLSEGCMAADCNWLVEPRAEWTRCLAKIRYNSEPVPASAHFEALVVRFQQILEFGQVKLLVRTWKLPV